MELRLPSYWVSSLLSCIVHIGVLFFFFNLMLYHDKTSNLKNSFTVTVLMTAYLKHGLNDLAQKWICVSMEIVIDYFQDSLYMAWRDGAAVTSTSKGTVHFDKVPRCTSRALMSEKLIPSCA